MGVYKEIAIFRKIPDFGEGVCPVSPQIRGHSGHDGHGVICMSFEENCVFVPIAPEDAERPKRPNIYSSWPGPTINEPGTYNGEADELYTFEEKEKTDWNRWGIAGWRGPERLLIIDVDLYKMSDSRKQEILTAINEKCPTTRIHKSQRGGAHLFFLVDPEDLSEDGTLPDSIALGKNIDDKLNGYVLAPSVDGYEVKADSPPALIKPEDLPEELLETVKPRSSHKDSGAEVEAPPELEDKLPCFSKLVEKGVEEGNRHHSIFALAGHLRDCGIPKGVARSFIRDFWKTLPQPPEADVKRPWKDAENVLDDIYDKEKYRVGCKTVKKHFPEYCDEENCPVEDKMAGEADPIILEKKDLSKGENVGDFFTFEGDQPFSGRLQISAEGKPKARNTRLEVVCRSAFTDTKTHSKEDCQKCPFAKKRYISMEDESFNPSAFAKYFDTDNPFKAFEHLAKNDLSPQCPAWRKKLDITGENQRAVTTCKVVDHEAREGRAWFPHGEGVNLSKTPNWINANGWICQGRGGTIGVLVSSFESESSVKAPTKEEVERARRTLLKHVPDAEDVSLEKSVPWKIAKALRAKSNLKGDELTKGFFSDALIHASPTWVKTPEGPRQLGATAIEIGTTTTAKSLRTRFLLDFLGIGDYESGKKTEAGLTAGVEKIEGLGWVVSRGALPSADLSTLVVDNVPPQALEEQAESRRDGLVRVSAIKNAKLWARCRLKIINNPPNPFDEYLYKCLVLSGWDRKLIARFAFATLTSGVSIEERYETKDDSGEEDGELLEAFKTIIRWNQSRETTYKPEGEIWKKIMEKGEALEEDFGNPKIPLLLRSNPYKLTLLAYSFALLEGYEEPEERHVKLANKWLVKCARELELGDFADYWREEHELTEKQYREAKEKISKEVSNEMEDGALPSETAIWEIIRYLGKHGTGQRDEIAGVAEKSGKTISRKAKVLKGL